MATMLKEVDAVMVGMGWTGSIMARELTKAGLNVVGLERGADRMPARGLRAARHPRRSANTRCATSCSRITATETVTLRHIAVGDGAADPPLGLVPAGHRRRRRGLALERPPPGASLPCDHILRSHLDRSATARTPSRTR